MTILHRKNGAGLAVGKSHPTRIMALIGASHTRDHGHQLKKLDAIGNESVSCDIISDLSIVPLERPLWQDILDAGFVAATLPIYTIVPINHRIDASALLERIREQAESGIGLITIHPTPTREIINFAEKRIVPCTSRGGAMVITDLLNSRETENVYLKILPDIAHIASKYGMAISLGASFRSANIFDALDDAQMLEIQFQIEIARQLTDAGCKVIIESPGHAQPKDIQTVAGILAQTGYPIMPLGPIPTDTAIGQDHVSAAIGATLMGLRGAAHILAAVTREEHTGGIPSIESTIEAIKAASVAAHIIDLELMGDTSKDRAIVMGRAENKTCVYDKTSKGCSRCANKCPLWTISA